MGQILTHIRSVRAAIDNFRQPPPPSARLSRHVEETDSATTQLLDDALRRAVRRFPSVAGAFHDAVVTKRNYDRAWFIRLGYEAGSADWQRAGKLMAAAELTYASVVILDDIVDGGVTRLGKPCLYLRLGIERALYTAELLRSIGHQELLDAAETVAISRDAFLVLLRSEERAFQDLNYGQYRDLDLSEADSVAVTDDDVLELLRLTTGVDIGNCLATGAIACGASTDVVSNLRSAGEKIGTLLQIRDDLLDYADPAFIDKGGGCDFEKHRMKLPFVVAMRMATENDRRVLLAASRHDWDRIRAMVLTENTVAYIADLASTLRSGAMDLATKLPPGTTRDLLCDFVENVIAID